MKSIKISLFCSLLGYLWIGTVQATTSAGLEDYAQQLINAGNLQMSGDTFCELGSGKGDHQPAFINNNADALLNVATRRKIYLFAHGFYPSVDRHKPSMRYVKAAFKGHLEIIRSLGKPYAACLFLANTTFGFGAPQPIIGNFLFALRLLTDDIELYHPARKIYLVGYSAGANYAKQALVDYRAHLKRNNLDPTGVADTRMKVIFLAGVHQGTDFKQLAQQAVMLLNTVSQFADSEFMHLGRAGTEKLHERLTRLRGNARERAKRAIVIDSRGVKQLRSGSRDIKRLNTAFKAALMDTEVFNLYGSIDRVAPPSATFLPNVPAKNMANTNHFQFVTWPLSAELKKELKQAYQ